MIEMRWKIEVTTIPGVGLDNDKVLFDKVLQYRQLVEATNTYANKLSGMQHVYLTPNMQWSPWVTVPTV